MSTNDKHHKLTGRTAWPSHLSRFFLLALGALTPLILLGVFGFSIKTTPEYKCAIRTAKSNAQVVARIGEPITPGLFAWTAYFESGGGLRQGSFSTALSGPQGRTTIQVQFYRTPIGATLGMWIQAGKEEIEIYNGRYPCP